MDVQFLIQEIDRIISQDNIKQINIEEKSESQINTRLNNIRMNTIFISSTKFLEKDNKEIKLSKKNNKIKAKNKTVNENTNQKIKEMKNEIIIKQSEIKKESGTVKIKKNDKIEIKSLMMIIKNKFDFKIKRKRDISLDDKNFRKILLFKSFNINQYADEFYIKDNDDIDNKKKKTVIEKKSKADLFTISPNYFDENNSDKVIKYKNNKLKAISFDYLLKQIITNNFIEKKENVEFIYALCQQCFCFLKKENLFQKIIDCYNYYKKLNTPFEDLKKLLYFLNLLIVEMYEYYYNKEIPYDKILENFYKELESELTKKLNIKEDEKMKNELNEKPSTKRLSYSFALKIKMLEELKNNENNQEKKNKKEKDIKIKEENDNELILNEILNVCALFESKQENNYYILLAKNGLKLYKDYIEIKEKKKNKFRLSTLVKSTKSIEKKYINYFSVLNYEIEEIGEALISISKEDLNKIERRELYCAIFLKKNKEKTCPYLTECITKFNNLTLFIIEDILSYDYPKIRANIFYRWLKIAEYLKQRKDHNDCLAIYSALNHYLIKGLLKTKKEMKSKTKTLLKSIRDYCSFDGNYKNFREEIQICITNGEFYLPYLGLLLRDVAFYETNFDYIIENNLINVEKIELIQNIIDEFFYYKKIKDININKNKYPEELNFFKKLEIIKEDDLEILSNKLEPKFILNDFPQKYKRHTNLDKKYFK